MYLEQAGKLKTTDLGQVGLSSLIAPRLSPFALPFVPLSYLLLMSTNSQYRARGTRKIYLSNKYILFLLMAISNLSVHYPKSITRAFQFANAEYIHDKEIGIKFDMNAFSEEMLINGVMEVNIYIFSPRSTILKKLTITTL